MSLLGPVSSNMGLASKHSDFFIPAPTIYGHGLKDPYYVLHKVDPARRNVSFFTNMYQVTRALYNLLCCFLCCIQGAPISSTTMCKPNRALASGKLFFELAPVGMKEPSADKSIASSKEAKEVLVLRDFLLRKALVLDPSQRVAARAALADPMFHQ
jgi:hypothetical protein